MAFSISINVANDALQTEGRNAFAAEYRWEGPTIPDVNNPGQTIPNPRGTTKQQFLEFSLKSYYKDIIRVQRRRDAEAAIIIPDVGD